MNLAAYFVQAVRRFPDAVAVVDEQVRWSYRDLYTEVTAVAAHLQQRGLAPGDHVLVVLKIAARTSSCIGPANSWA